MKKSRARRINSAPLPCITSSFTPREEENNEKNFFFFFFFFCFLLFFFFFVETKHKNSKKTNFFFVFFQKEKKKTTAFAQKKGGGGIPHTSLFSHHHLYARVHLRPRERSRRQRGDRALVVAPPSSRVVKQRKVFLFFFWR